MDPKPGRPLSLDLSPVERKLDPVCGMQVRADAPLRHPHAGVEYVFCAPGCLEKFRANPGRYLDPHAPPEPMEGVPAGTAVEWICPMDPEVLEALPGACRVCGMALEPRVALSAEEPPNPEFQSMRRRLWIAAALTLPLMALDMGHHAGLIPHAVLSGATGSLLELALSAPVVVWAGRPFLERGIASVVRRSLNMFTLIGLGVGVAFLYSLAATLAPGRFPAAFRDASGAVPNYFEPAAAIITLTLLGQVLELRARSRTGESLRGLLRLAPATARVVLDHDLESDIPVAEVHVGDRLRVRPGERVPVDGVIVEGVTSIDESMVTGEPLAAERGPGSAVVGGTLNGNGSFVMRADRIGRDTLLARIVQQVSDAQRSRAPVQDLADRVAGWFVPAVVVTAVLTFAGWMLLGPEPRGTLALVNAVSVLIIACPCALGLATPMSVSVAMGRAAQGGVLFRDAAALQRLQEVDTLVFDKTGTLTEGRPRLAQVRLPGPGSEEAVLALAAALERGSQHPLAAAVLRGAAERGIRARGATGAEYLPGRGVRGEVDGAPACLGTAAFLEQSGVDPAPLRAAAEAAAGSGSAVAYVAANGSLAGLLVFEDRIRESAAAALADLRRRGMRLIMLTGDQPLAAEAVARRLGIAEVHAGALPEDKLGRVKQLGSEGRRVAMAGDGINDAAALAEAHVGIAMGRGTDVAIESAGVTLVRGDLRGIAFAVSLSRATLRNVKQNLWLAFLYNSLALPLAAGLLYPFTGWLLSPAIAAAAMSLSSVTVIGNALRLRGLKLGPAADAAGPRPADA